ncbi:hypothetical protein GCM10008101_06800 [Lysobacter xinjiangensis]|uniref:Uncharacterized protein n=1 Tax=Cognatilysobacter xinjiangensis TaxID=546892 RepID=A0ABQ3BSC3_9GAMM|nr:hypothetical protein GCM10008101_06800 [Lysobacter xinjiangensis]
MTGADALRAYQALYQPSAEQLRRYLPELGESLAAQLDELHKRPCADRCDRLAVNLEGALLHVRRYRERLLVEGEGHGE